MVHGTTVNLRGSRWQACVERDCLILRNTIQTDDKKEQTVSRITTIKHEVEGRLQELEALTADLGRVETECESVMDGGGGG